MYSAEMKEKDAEITELGEEFNFKLGKFYSIEPKGWKEMERVWFVSIDSPDLEKLREKYGLTKKLNENEFHFTCAVRKK
jgi:DNA-binding PadR family transcriptional regulator